MNIIKRTALVPFSAQQMFELVNKIEDYPDFLPWCHTSTIHSRTEKTVEATLVIAWAGFHKSFATVNILHPYDKMEIQLVSGPFKHLNGNWSFIALGETASRVTLDLEFEFTGSLLDKLFQPIFNQIANTLVDSFCQQAEKVYAAK